MNIDDIFCSCLQDLLICYCKVFYKIVGEIEMRFDPFSYLDSVEKTLYCIKIFKQANPKETLRKSHR